MPCFKVPLILLLLDSIYSMDKAEIPTPIGTCCPNSAEALVRGDLASTISSIMYLISFPRQSTPHLCWLSSMCLTYAGLFQICGCQIYVQADRSSWLGVCIAAVSSSPSIVLTSTCNVTVRSPCLSPAFARCRFQPSVSHVKERKKIQDIFYVCTVNCIDPGHHETPGRCE